MFVAFRVTHALLVNKRYVVCDPIMQRSFSEFPCPACAVVSCSSGPQAEGNSLKGFRKTSLHDGMGNSVDFSLDRSVLFLEKPPESFCGEHWDEEHVGELACMNALYGNSTHHPIYF